MSLKFIFNHSDSRSHKPSFTFRYSPFIIRKSYFSTVAREFIRSILVVKKVFVTAFMATVLYLETFICLRTNCTQIILINQY